MPLSGSAVKNKQTSVGGSPQRLKGLVQLLVFLRDKIVVKGEETLLRPWTVAEEHASARGGCVGSQTRTFERPRAISVFEREDRVVVDDGVLVPSYVPHFFVQLSGRICQIHAHRLCKGSAVRASLLQAGGQVDSVGPRVSRRQLYRDCGTEPAGLPPEPLRRPIRGPDSIVTRCGHAAPSLFPETTTRSLPLFDTHERHAQGAEPAMRLALFVPGRVRHMGEQSATRL